MASTTPKTTTTTTTRLRFLRKPLHHDCSEQWMNNLEIEVEKNRIYAHVKIDDAYDTVINEARKIAGCDCAKRNSVAQAELVPTIPVVGKTVPSPSVAAINVSPPEPTSSPKPPLLPVPNRITFTPTQQQISTTLNQGIKRQFNDTPVVPPNGGQMIQVPQTQLSQLPPLTTKKNISGVPCPQLSCDLIFTNIYDYYDHLSSHHSVTALRCPVKNCGIEFSAFVLSEIKDHTKKAHSELASRLWRCKRCNYECSSWTAQVFHNFQNHLGGKWWCRKGCGFSADSRNASQEHEYSCKLF